MRRVRLPALRHPVLETLSHTALSVGHLLTPPHRRGHRVQRGQRPAAADRAGRPDPGRRARRRPGVAAGQVGPQRPPLLPGQRAVVGAAGRRADRRRGRDPGLLPRALRRGLGVHPVRRPDPHRGRRRPAGRSGPRTGRLPPGGGPDGAGEPRRRDHRGVHAQRRGQAAGRGRLGALRQRPPAPGRRARQGRRPGAAARRGLGPGPAGHALRRLGQLPARALGRRHQPVAAAGHGRRRPT